MDIVTNVERRLNESASLLIIMIRVQFIDIMKYKKEKRLEDQKSSEHSKE